MKLPTTCGKVRTVLKGEPGTTIEGSGGRGPPAEASAGRSQRGQEVLTGVCEKGDWDLPAYRTPSEFAEVLKSSVADGWNIEATSGPAPNRKSSVVMFSEKAARIYPA